MEDNYNYFVYIKGIIIVKAFCLGHWAPPLDLRRKCLDKSATPYTL